MGHIFISYSHKDTTYVEKLEAKLISEGFDVWVDHRIDYGSRWTKEIEKAIVAGDLGLNPQSDGRLIRLNVPPLSTEVRKKMVARIKELAEECEKAGIRFCAYYSHREDWDHPYAYGNTWDYETS